MKFVSLKKLENYKYYVMVNEENNIYGVALGSAIKERSYFIKSRNLKIARKPSNKTALDIIKET